MGAVISAEQDAYPEPHASAEVVSPLHGRRLATHCGSEYCPIRVTVEYSPATLVPTGPLTAGKIATLQNVIIPAAVARLQEMYLVKPVAGRLTFSRTCQTLCSASGDPRQGLCATYADPASSPATCNLGDDGANNPWTVPQSYYGDQSNTCGGVTNNYPASSGTPGVADSDFHLIIRVDSGSRCTGGTTLAFAGTCQKDALTDRPLLGVSNFCPESISSDAADIRGEIYTAIHEFHHAMGFSSSAWPLFRDASGNPRTARDPVQRSIVAHANRITVGPGGCNTGGSTTTVSRSSSSTVRYFAERGIAKCNTDSEQLTNGGCVSRMVTPEARARAREYFNCPTLPGAELENQRTSSACAVAGSHLEQRVHNQNFMAPVTSHWSVITPVEMGIMQDSGWYVANYSAADSMSGEWGHLAGCPMAEEKCVQSSGGSTPASVLGARGRAHFCTEIGTGGPNTALQSCTVDRRAVGYCTGRDGLTNVPSYFQYFSSADEGSVSPQQLDICPQVLAFSNFKCFDSSNGGAGSAQRQQGMHFGEGSRCTTRSLIQSGFSSPAGVGCYATRCITDMAQTTGLSVVGTSGLRTPSEDRPWLLLGAAHPTGGDSTLRYLACADGTESGNPDSALFSGTIQCIDPAIYCAKGPAVGPAATPLATPSALPSPSAAATPAAGGGGGGEESGGISADDNPLTDFFDEHGVPVYAGAAAVAVIALLLVWYCCCRKTKPAPEQQYA